MRWKPLIIFLWMTCGFLNWGMMFAYKQHEYPQTAQKDYLADLVGIPIMAISFGPFGLPGSFVITRFGKHGFKLW